MSNDHGEGAGGELRVLHLGADAGGSDLEAASDRVAVEPTSDPARAREALAAGGVDCVVCDHGGGVDGLAFLRTAGEVAPDVPVVLRPTDGSERPAGEALAAGGAGYVPRDADPELLVARVEAAADRARDEVDPPDRGHRTVERLHEVATALTACTTADRVHELAVEAAVDVLGFDWCVLALADGEYFELAAASREAPASAGECHLRIDEGIAGEAYRTGESIPVEDVGSRGSGRADTDSFRAGLTVPVGDHGVLQGAAAGPGRLDDRDRRLAELLAAHVAEALDRVGRERELARYETMVETVADGVYVLDAEGRYRYVNSYIEELIGRERAELVGRSAAAFVADGDVERFEGAIAEMLAGERETASFEFGLLTADGEVVPTEARVALLPARDGVEGTVGVVRDVSERKARERELERQNERLERFASVVSHDLRNPLSAARGRLELARETGDEEHFAAARRALDRMERLVEDLLVLAREGEFVNEPVPVGVADLAREAWEPVGEGRLEVTTDATVMADRDRLRQALGNLFRNAVEHAGPEPTVRVGVEEGTLFVADDGPGVDPDARDRVFEHGYSTGTGGTGVGLSVVRTIAGAHGWSVAVAESRAGGARFEFEGVEFV